MCIGLVYAPTHPHYPRRNVLIVLLTSKPTHFCGSPHQDNSVEPSERWSNHHLYCPARWSPDHQTARPVLFQFSSFGRSPNSRKPMQWRILPFTRWVKRQMWPRIRSWLNPSRTVRLSSPVSAATTVGTYCV